MTLFSRLLRQAPATPSAPAQDPKSAVAPNQSGSNKSGSSKSGSNKSGPNKSGKSVADRIADLQTQSADFIAGIALSNEDDELRVAAIAKLSEGEALYKLATQQGAGTVQRAAQQRVAKLIDDRVIDFDDYRRKTPDIATVLSVAGYCSNPAFLQQTVSTCDVALLAKLASEGASSKLRQLAAEAIEDPVYLKQVLKDARSKDKNVYRIVKTKCDALHAQEKAAEETQIAIHALCLALERHIHHPFDNLFAPSLEHLNAQWNALANQAPTAIKVRAEQAIDRCREIITEHLQAMAGQAARAGAIANADNNRQSVLADLRALLSGIYNNEQVDKDAVLNASANTWKELEAFKHANASDQSAYTKLRDGITRVSTAIALHGSITAQAQRFTDAGEIDVVHVQALRDTLSAATLLGDSIPTAVQESATALQSWENARHEAQEAAAHALRQLGGLIRKALATLSEGKTGPAAGMRRAIEEKLHSIGNLPPNLQTQLQQLDEKLNVLQDWRSYAVAPKRVELIEQMEALIGTGEPPQELAEKIKRLQDEWKLISKGNVDDTEAEWQRFHQAAQTAYQPCREFFAVQAEQRHNNLEKRKALLTRLSKFAELQNWEQCDWREVARALRESKQQWRSHQPVERSPNKPIQESFEKLTADLQNRLDAEFAKNVEEKKSLIARAQKLIGLDDTRKATDDVKFLQQQWKNVGPVAHEDDQKLWTEFREQCDAVFAKKQQVHGALVAALDESKTKAIALCAEAEQVATLSGHDLIEGVKKLSALRELFDAIGDLPRANARDLNLRFERAIERCEKAVAAQRARDKAQAWDNVLLAGDKIRSYRLAVVNSDSESDAYKQGAQSYIDSVQHWPKNGLQAVKAELAKSSSSDIAANELALKTLCVRAEILTDSSTPEADQAFRRNYQLQRLMKGMGQAATPTKDELDTMVFEWIAVGATRDNVHADLLARFSRCREKIVNAK
jgi:DNA repair protein SbcC/Rad50